jgi:hypothetical protein
MASSRSEPGRKRRETRRYRPEERASLLQLGVLGFGGDEDGDVGVGVFP